MNNRQRENAILFRLKILNLLKYGKMTKYELSDALNVSSDTIYGHIRTLTMALCINKQKNGCRLPDSFTLTGKEYIPAQSISPEVLLNLKVTKPKDSYFYVETVNNKTIYRFTDKHIPSDRIRSAKTFVSGSTLFYAG